MFIDSHAHLQSVFYENGIDDIMSNLDKDLIDFVVCVGTAIDTSLKAVELSKNDRIYATVGVHPDTTNIVDDAYIERLLSIAKSSNKVVAIGETGLDYHYDGYKEGKAKQFFAFDSQIQLAKQLKLPYIVHLRDAYDDFEKHFLSTPAYGAVMHCFSGTSDHALKYVDKGYFVSFSGNVTYKKAEDIKYAAKVVPLDRMLIETDCPFLAPMPHRGKQNQPAYVALVAQEIANIKGIDIQQVAMQTKLNAQKLFKIS